MYCVNVGQRTPVIQNIVRAMSCPPWLALPLTALRAEKRVLPGKSSFDSHPLSALIESDIQYRFVPLCTWLLRWMSARSARCRIMELRMRCLDGAVACSGILLFREHDIHFPFVDLPWWTRMTFWYLLYHAVQRSYKYHTNLINW